MRITQSMMTRNYLRGLSRNLNDVAQSNARMTSQRKFSRVSEDTSGASRAFTVRERLYRSESFLGSIEGAAGELASSENNLRAMNDIIVSVKEKALRGMNASNSAESREVLAREIGNLKEQMLQLANSKFGDKFLFGGSNNTSAAFTDANGKLQFQGIDVDLISVDADGKYVYTDLNGVVHDVPHMNDRYIDIGLGMTMNGANVDPKSAFKINTNGIDALGFGMDGNATKNIYNVISEIEAALKNNDPEKLDPLIGKLTKGSDEMIMSVTDIGSRSNFLDQMSERFKDDILTLQDEQKGLELISLEEESIYNSSYYATWMTTLKLGNKLIPPSLFDFMN